MKNKLTVTDQRKFDSLTESEIKQCKDAYMAYVPVSKIARDMKIARTSLQYHCNKYWQKERELERIEETNKFLDTKRLDFTKMSSSAIEIVKKSLNDLANRPHPPTIAEATKVAHVLEVIDRITRLDDGSPTEITGEKPVSVVDLKKKIALDPFSGDDSIEEVSYEEVTDAKDTDSK